MAEVRSLFKFFPENLAPTVFGRLLFCTKSTGGRKNTLKYSVLKECVNQQQLVCCPKQQKVQEFHLCRQSETGRWHFTDCDSGKINIGFSNLHNSYLLGEGAHSRSLSSYHSSACFTSDLGWNRHSLNVLLLFICNFLIIQETQCNPTSIFVVLSFFFGWFYSLQSNFVSGEKCSFLLKFNYTTVTAHQLTCCSSCTHFFNSGSDVSYLLQPVLDQPTGFQHIDD